jgi:hypothetical protein
MNHVQLMGHIHAVSESNGWIELVLRTKENYVKDGEAKDTLAVCKCSAKYGAKLLEMQQGSLIVIDGEIRGREHNGRFYCNVSINKFDLLWKPKQPASQMPPPSSQPQAKPQEQQQPRFPTSDNHFLLRGLNFLFPIVE